MSFFRILDPTSDRETLERVNKRAETGDPIAIYLLGRYYATGEQGFPIDYEKALGFYHRAGELGHAPAYNNIGAAYSKGEGVEVDEKKARHYYELAAMNGGVTARNNLGGIELRAGNIDKALRHMMIATSCGYGDSLAIMKILFSNELVTKNEYTAVLRSYQEYLGEIKSVQRDEAAAFFNDFKYIEN